MSDGKRFWVAKWAECWSGAIIYRREEVAIAEAVEQEQKQGVPWEVVQVELTEVQSD